MNASKYRNSNSHIIYYFTLLLIILYSFVLLGISVTPQSLLMKVFPKLSIIKGITLNDIFFRMRLCGIALLVLSIIIFFYYNRINSFIEGFINSFKLILIKSGLLINEENRLHILLLAAIIAVSVIIRIHYLFRQMRCDEAMTYVLFASKPLFIGLSDYITTNNHIFYTFLEHIFTKLLGNKPWVIRLPAFLAGILLVPTSYLLGRILYNKNAAILAAAFVASSSGLIDYSVNGRGYSIVILAFLFIIIFIAYMLQNPDENLWPLFVMASVIGFYTIPIMLYPFGLIMTWSLFSIMSLNNKAIRLNLVKQLILYSIISFIIIAICYIPVFIYNGTSLSKMKWLSPVPWDIYLHHIYKSCANMWQYWNIDIPAIIEYLMIGGFVCSIAYHSKISKYKYNIAIVGFIWIITIIILYRATIFTRVWLFLLPLYFIMASAGITFILNKFNARIYYYPIIGFFITVIITMKVYASQSPYFSTETGVLESGEAMALDLKNVLKPGDLVFAVTSTRPIIKYYFMTHKIPLNYMAIKVPDNFKNNEILIIENRAENQLLANVIEYYDIKDYTIFNKINYADGAIYFGKIK